MAKDLDYYLSLDYPILIRQMPDGQYCADIPTIEGCCGYGQTADEALDELQGVKEALFEAWLETGRRIPEPVVHLELPASLFARLPNRDELLPYVQPLLKPCS